MAESTLAVKYTDLKAYIAREAGWDNSNLTAQQTADLARIVQKALLMVYFPKDERGRDYEHDWHFLKPVAELTTQSGTSDYELPDDFGGLCGSFYYNTDSAGWIEVRTIPVGELLELRQAPASASESTYRIEYAALLWQDMTGINQGQRAKIGFWPNVTGTYTLKYQYQIMPDTINTTREYPYGGAKFSELYITACLAAVESLIDDMPQGPRQQEFRQVLAQAIDMDQRASAPDFIGYNADRSDERYDERTVMDRTRWGYVTYNGVRY